MMSSHPNPHSKNQTDDSDRLNNLLDKTGCREKFEDLQVRCT